LILRAIANLKRTLIEESLIVALVCVVFCCTRAARWWAILIVAICFPVRA